MNDAPLLPHLPPAFRALVIGASGALGAAFVEALQAERACGEVVTLGRHTSPALDLQDEGSIAQAAQALGGRGPWHLVLVATGLLHGPGLQPEKRLADLQADSLRRLLEVNTIGPALVMRHFGPQLDRRHSVLGVLSAKVGSITDNRLGGWYGYRASKAALNMLLRTAAIELRRTHPGAILAALHPGTVKSGLSRPFRGDEIGREPGMAARDLLQALGGLTPDDSGSFVTYDGQRLPW